MRPALHWLTPAARQARRKVTPARERSGISSLSSRASMSQIEAGGQEVRRARREAPVSKRAVKRDASPAVDYGALARFRYQIRKFLAFSETAVQGAGLTPQQYQALLAIKGFSSPDAISVGDLARCLLVRHHTAVGLVDRMTKLGLLDRIADQEDGRRVLVKLTRTGEQKLRSL